MIWSKIKAACENNGPSDWDRGQACGLNPSLHKGQQRCKGLRPCRRARSALATCKRVHCMRRTWRELSIHENNLTQKSPVVRWATEQAAGLGTTPQQDTVCVHVCVWWVELWQSSQPWPCGLWCGWVPLLDLIRVSLVTSWQEEKERKKRQEVERKLPSAVFRWSV